jgi:hypothetical protein
MNWYSKLFSNEEINSDKYQNIISEIRSQYNKHPEKLNEFAVFKEDLQDNNHMLYFSPTSDENFLSIINRDLKAESCEKPNLNNAKLFLGRYI